MIDDAFIGKWHPQYDQSEHDEKEYQKIVADVSKEVPKIHTISKSTFERILNWKAPRVKHFVKLEEFDDYAKGIKQALQASEERKLAILDDLDGIGVPVASTILHFIYPRSFPIMDVRTAEVLYFLGYIKSKQRDQKRYVPFRFAILGIQQQYPQWSLREIDRALFAYHKREREPKTRGASGDIDI